MPMNNLNGQSEQGDTIDGVGRGNQRPTFPGNAQIRALSIEQIEQILNSPEHYERTPSRNYGERDPLTNAGEYIISCCKPTRAQLITVSTKDLPPQWSSRLSMRSSVAQVVRCEECGRQGTPSLREWRAVIDWCFIRAQAGCGTLEDIPFFNLRGFSSEKARSHIEAIRHDLQLRVELAKKRRDLGVKDVGGRYIAKLDAYVGWCNVALQIISFQARASRASNSNRDTGLDRSQAAAGLPR